MRINTLALWIVRLFFAGAVGFVIAQEPAGYVAVAALIGLGLSCMSVSFERDSRIKLDRQDR